MSGGVRNSLPAALRALIEAGLHVRCCFPNYETIAARAEYARSRWCALARFGAAVATTASAASADLVKGLGADVVIDYRKDDFDKVLSGYDVVLNSQDGKTLEKSLAVLKPGGKLISISGPPDPEFARTKGLNPVLRLLMRLLSWGIRAKAKRHGVSFSFLFMWAQGDQLSKITALIESGAIRPVVDRVFPFDAANEALAYVETGRAKGKVVIKIR